MSVSCEITTSEEAEAAISAVLVWLREQPKGASPARDGFRKQFIALIDDATVWPYVEGYIFLQLPPVQKRRK